MEEDFLKALNFIREKSLENLEKTKEVMPCFKG